jgi:hypothetical protein
MNLRKVLIKEYDNFTLYAIYKGDMFLYKTTESKIKDIYRVRGIEADKMDALMRGDV